MNQKRLLSLGIALGLIVIGWFVFSQNSTTTPTDYAASCQEAGGTWLAEQAECEYISSDWCSEKQGVFNECASACRNNPEAELCTANCVPVCQL